MKPFLSDRQLYTTDGHERSHEYWLAKRVPQESSLSPLHVTVYIDDILLSLISSTETKGKAYADDITIMATSREVSDEVIKLEKILERANVWTQENQMKNSCQKSELISYV